MKKALAAASAAAIAATTLGVVSLPSASAHGGHHLGAPLEQTEGIKWFARTTHVKAHNRNRAVIKVRYKCEGMGVHLWASLKQGPDVNSYEPTPERPYPPADVARAWYETPEGVLPTCDGTYNTLRYTVTRVTEGTETHPEAWRKLWRGKAFAQFVVFSLPEGANPETDEPNREAFAGWVRVTRPHHHHHHH